MIRLKTLLLAALVAALLARASFAQTLTTLYSFDGPHGGYPQGDLMLSGDSTTLHGMTNSGGDSPHVGTIFSIPVTGGIPNTLFSFDQTHGEGPAGDLTLINSTFYGMTVGGGEHSLGTIFKVPVAGGTPTTLFSFDGLHGTNPFGSLTLSGDGATLYGMTALGGANNEGTILSVPVTGGTPTTLFSFDHTHGDHPGGDLTLSADGSTLYGMTEAGGANSAGTIFSMPVVGGTPTTLFSFDGAHGAFPHGNLTLSPDDSTLYGMASEGGEYGVGTVFSLTLVPEPSSFVLAGFAGATGAALAFLRRRNVRQKFATLWQDTP